MIPSLRKLQTYALLLLASFTAGAQDIHFSQAFETPLLRNPALAGLFAGDVRVQTVYRSQWNSVTDAYHTTSANAEYKLPVGQGDDFLTLGLQVVYDKAGTIALTTTQILPVANYHKSLSAERNMYLSLGFMGGYVQRSFDASKMTTNSQFDGVSHNSSLATGETFMSPNYGYADGSAGLSFNSQIGPNADNNIYLGAAYHHFNKSKKISFYSSNEMEMKPRMVGSAGLRLSLADRAYMTFEGDYSKQGDYTETIMGILYTVKLDDVENPKYLIHAGTYIRMKDAIIPVAKLEVRPLSFAVSYDANISALKTASQGRGGLELSVSWQKYLDRYNSSRDAVRCPKF